MPDDVVLNAGAGGDTIGADLVGAVKYQVVKVGFGLDAALTRVTATTTLPVDVGAGALLIATTATVGTTTIIQNPNTGAFPAYLLASTPTIGNVGQGGPFDIRLIASTPSIGTVGLSSNDFRLIASTPTIGAVTQAGGWSVVNLASTPTIGGVNATQTGGWDLRLIASTPTVGTVTCIQGGSSGAWPVQLLASTPTIGNVGQGGAFDIRLIASTPTIGGVSQVATWDVRSIATTATQPVTESGDWNLRLIASTPTFGGVLAVLSASTATAATVTVVGHRGRAFVCMSMTPTAVTTEALATAIWNNAGVITRSTSYIVTSGKTLCIQAMHLGGHITSTSEQWSRANLRVAAAIVATSPILATLESGTMEIATVVTNTGLMPADMCFGDGIMINPGQQIGVSHISAVTTGVVTASLVGYEF